MPICPRHRADPAPQPSLAATITACPTGPSGSGDESHPLGGDRIRFRAAPAATLPSAEQGRVRLTPIGIFEHPPAIGQAKRESRKILHRDGFDSLPASRSAASRDLSRSSVRLTFRVACSTLTARIRSKPAGSKPCAAASCSRSSRRYSTKGYHRSAKRPLASLLQEVQRKISVTIRDRLRFESQPFEHERGGAPRTGPDFEDSKRGCVRCPGRDDRLHGLSQEPVGAIGPRIASVNAFQQVDRRLGKQDVRRGFATGQHGCQIS